MEHLILAFQIPQLTAFFFSLIITVTTASSLLYLFSRSENGKFYPAMPYVTAGCFIGYGIVMLLV